MSPEIQLSHIQTDHGKIAVVRDDFLEGGTKQRGIIPFIQHMQKGCGIKEFVYASPPSGFAQVALSVSCKSLNVDCTIFREKPDARVEFDVGFKGLWYSGKFGGHRIYFAKTLNDAERAAGEYVKDKPFVYKIPLGFNEPFYKKCLKNELEIQWKILCNKLGYIPNRLWLPVGSGTLANVFSSIATETQLMCVDVRVLPKNDARIQNIRQLPNVEYITAVESFAQPAEQEPPIPSNTFYDAKLWRFINRAANPMDVWWNVAS